jgi:hypothetical protein
MHQADAEFDAAQVLLRLDGRVSELADWMNGQSVNHVLWSGTVLLDANGTFQESFRVPFGGVGVANLTGAQITVVNAPLERIAPTSGRGVFICAIAGDGTFPIVGNVLSIYGPAGGQVVLVVTADKQAIDV